MNSLTFLPFQSCIYLQKDLCCQYVDIVKFSVDAKMCVTEPLYIAYKYLQLLM